MNNKPTDTKIMAEPDAQSQIAVCQPNETVRLETRYAYERIRLPQLKVAELFGVQKAVISKHLKNIYSTGELSREVTVSKMETVGEQCGKFTKTICGICHDRFIIVDQKNIFWTGVSMKDLGKKCFAFTKLDAGEIRRIKKEAFAASMNV